MGGSSMSKWMISHATAALFSPFLSIAIISLVVAISTNQFIGMFEGAWVLLYLIYIYLFISLPILLIASFIKNNTLKQTYAMNLILLILVGIVVQFFLFTSGPNYLAILLYIVIISLSYLFVQTVVEHFIATKLNIVDEDRV
jgi:hypothetical protein